MNIDAKTYNHTLEQAIRMSKQYEREKLELEQAIRMSKQYEREKLELEQAIRKSTEEDRERVFKEQRAHEIRVIREREDDAFQIDRGIRESLRYIDVKM